MVRVKRLPRAPTLPARTARDGAGRWLYGIATNLAGTHRHQEERRYRALAKADASLALPSEEDLIADRVAAQATGRTILGGIRRPQPNTHE